MIRLSIGLLAMGCMTGTVCANEGSESLVKAFQAFCTLPLQSFEELDAKASAQKLRVQTDYKPREEDSNSERVRTKSWLMEAGNAAYQLVAIRRTAVNGAQRDMLRNRCARDDRG